MNLYLKAMFVAVVLSAVVHAQGSHRANGLGDVVRQLQGAQRVSLIASRVPPALLQTLNTASRADGFTLAEVFVPQDDIARVVSGLCATRTARAAVIRILQLPTAPKQTSINPVLSIHRADGSSVLVQGPILAGGAGETRITTGDGIIANAGTQLIGVFAQQAVLVHAC